jgi:hypothetical protein
VQAPAAQPAQGAHLPLPHWESFVHQHGVAEAVHVPAGEVTSLQLPLEQAQAVGAEVTGWQPTLSVALPVQVPLHWLFALTHLPLEQSESAAQRQAVCAALETGAGERVVVHA